MVKKGFLPNCNINEIKNYISTKLQLFIHIIAKIK